MSLIDRLLAEPSFIERDPQALVQSLVAEYESLTGKTLYPAQLERILIDIIAYRESLLREAIQDAAKLNLVRYSRAPMLDMLGENIGVARLEAKPATTLLTFTLATPLLVNRVLPKGTLANVGTISFATDEDVTVYAGALSILEVAASCTQPGLLGNGFMAGQINALVEPVSGFDILSVVNSTTSADGADAEEDEHFRERIVLAPEAFTTAGSEDSYRFHALSAHQSIIDVAVVSPIPGQVNLHPLLSTGLPSIAIKTRVATVCSAKKVRPLCDTVVVLDPNPINFSISAALTLYRTADSTLALSTAQAAAKNYAAEMRGKLGVDIVTTQINKLLHGYGVYKVVLSSPAADVVLAEADWANCTSINISIAGLADG